MTKKILLSSIVASAITTSAVAEETVNLDTLKVWETELVSSSLNLGKDSIETKQADHLSDLLRDLPGVDVGGSHSINNRIIIRGLKDEDLDITIDGAKIQNVNMFHHIGNLLINSDVLKKVDLEVGTNSVVNGSLGGSVSFETRDGEDLLEDGKNFGARISTTYNSNDSLSGSITAYGKLLENGDFMIYHNYLNKNNWENGKGEEKLGVEGSIKNTLIKYGHKLNDSNKIIISYDTITDKGDYAPRPDFGNEWNFPNGIGTTFPTQYDRDTFTLKHELRLENTTVDTSLYNNKNNLKRTETWVGRSPRPDLVGVLDGKVTTTGLNVKAQTSLETGSMLHIFTYGGFYDKQESKVKWNGNTYGINEEGISKVLFVEDAIDFDNGLLLTPGIRYNGYDFDGSYGEIDDNELTYGLSAEYSINDGLTLLANVTTLYKGVEMLEPLAGTTSSIAQNTDLKSETGINKEIGFKYIKNNALGADSIGFLFKYFNTTIDDYIETVWVSRTEANMVNAGELDIKGFEASFAYNKGDLSTLLTYSHSESNFEKTGNPLKRQPGDAISLGIDYNINQNLDLSWNSLFVREEDDLYYDGSSTYLVKESYNIHNIALNWKPKAVNGLTVIAGVENIFDEEYYAHTSEHRVARGAATTDYEPGRNFKLTLSYKF